MSWIHLRWTCGEQAERDRRLDLEDQVRTLQAEVSDLRGQLAEARRETARAGEKVADYLARKFMREPIFDQTHPTATAVVVEDVPIPKSRQQARDIVRERTLATEAELLAYATRPSARPPAQPESVD